MQTDDAKLRILQDIRNFTKVRRYRGMFPTKLAMFHDQNVIDELLEEGFIERIFIDLPCGSESKLLKLTEAGMDYLDTLCSLPPDPAVAVSADCEPESAEPDPEALTKDQKVLLSDIYHFSNIRRFGGMMPREELENYNLRDVNTLYVRGYIIRIKAESGSGKKRRGMMLSDKGLRIMGLD